MPGPAKRIRLLPGLALAAASVLAATHALPARATAFCEVKATRDGFVALRAAPSTKGTLMRRLNAGEMVQLDTTRPNPKGWTAVIFRSDDGAAEQVGWVSASLIEQECG